MNHRLLTVKVLVSLEIEDIAKVLFVAGLPNKPRRREVRQLAAEALGSWGWDGCLHRYQLAQRDAADQGALPGHQQYLSCLRDLADRAWPACQPNIRSAAEGQPLRTVL